jgi:hypothetical protein
MKDQAKTTVVNFIEYEPYDEFPTTTIKLGKITSEQVFQLLEAFGTNNSAPNACIKSLSMDYRNCVQFGPNNKNENKNNSELNLTGMFFPANNPQCTNCKGSDSAKVKSCARNLRAGKCQDEFIKNTLGKILFPQHYGKQK